MVLLPSGAAGSSSGASSSVHRLASEHAAAVASLDPIASNDLACVSSSGGSSSVHRHNNNMYMHMRRGSSSGASSSVHRHAPIHLGVAAVVASLDPIASDDMARQLLIEELAPWKQLGMSSSSDLMEKSFSAEQMRRFWSSRPEEPKTPEHQQLRRGSSKSAPSLPPIHHSGKPHTWDATKLAHKLKSSPSLGAGRHGGAKNHHVRPLPATRPEALSQPQWHAADFFDGQHKQRTEQADETLNRLSLFSDELNDGAAFVRDLREVRRSRYRVDEGPPAIARNCVKQRKKKKK